MTDYKAKFERLDRDFRGHINFLESQRDVRIERGCGYEADGLDLALVSARAFYRGNWQDQDPPKKKKKKRESKKRTKKM